MTNSAFVNTAGKVYAAAAAQSANDSLVVNSDPVWISTLTTTPQSFAVPYATFLGTKTASVGNIDTGVMAS